MIKLKDENSISYHVKYGEEFYIQFWKFKFRKISQKSGSTILFESSGFWEVHRHSSHGLWTGRLSTDQDQFKIYGARFGETRYAGNIDNKGIPSPLYYQCSRHTWSHQYTVGAVGALNMMSKSTPGGKLVVGPGCYVRLMDVLYVL